MQTIFDVKYFIKTQFLGYAREIFLNLDTSKRTNLPLEKKFLILSSGRSGSTLLENILASNSNIHCEGELLRGKNFKPKKVVKLTEQTCPTSIFGFKLLTYQLLEIQTAINNKKNFLYHLVEDGYKIIYLERSNSLLQALSVLYAMRRNVWHYKNEAKVKDFKMRLDPETLADTVLDFEIFKDQEKKLLEHIPYLYINYEEELNKANNLPATIDKLSNYLELPFSTPTIGLKKVTPVQLSNYVSNYREITSFIKSEKHLKQFAQPLLGV